MKAPMNDDVKTDTPPPAKPTRESIEARVVAVDKAVLGGRLTVMVLTMENGHLVSGESLAATAEGFNEDRGEAIAFENAMERAFQLEVYLWREQMWVAQGRPSYAPHDDQQQLELAEPPVPKIILSH
jgi:N4 Gp49/Sf6 Gp66 family protein